jgi:hypothetical protein
MSFRLALWLGQWTLPAFWHRRRARHFRAESDRAYARAEAWTRRGDALRIRSHEEFVRALAAAGERAGSDPSSGASRHLLPQGEKETRKDAA